MLRTLTDILRVNGYTPTGAPSGVAQALRLAKDSLSPLAIALVDLSLPDIDGIDLVSRLRELSDLTEVVILTGNASIDSAVRAMREDSYDYLIKPVQPEYLLPRSAGRGTIATKACRGRSSGERGSPALNLRPRE